MNESQKHQRFFNGIPSIPGLGHSRSWVPFHTQAWTGVIVAAAVAGLGLSGAPHLSAQDGDAKSPALEASQEPSAKFVPPPDPSSLRAPLPLPPERTGAGSLDLLPSFPAERPASGPLDLVIKRREDPSLVPDGPNPTEDAALALSQRHRFQLARAKALNDAEVHEALVAAGKARTDRELREAMLRHYTLLFKKMRQVDASLERLIRERENAALKPLQGGPRATGLPEKN